MTVKDLEQEYGPEYYANGLGPIPYGRSDVWLNFFSGIAEQVIRALHPRRVLDAGCAMGFLVEAFWDRGVYCEGFDISEYAISKVRVDIREYCSVASVTSPIAGRFDVVTCIEVLEHLPPELVKPAVANLCAAADIVLFSSTPSDLEEATHSCVRPPIFWLQLFAEHGFMPDSRFEASFIAPHAMLLKKGPTASDDFLLLFSECVRHKITVSVRSEEVQKLSAREKALQDERQHFRNREAQSEKELLIANNEQERLRAEAFSARASLAALQVEFASRASNLRILEQRLSRSHAERYRVMAELADLQVMHASDMETQRAEHGRLIDEAEKLRLEGAQIKADLNQVEANLHQLQADYNQVQANFNSVLTSRAWRLTERCRWPLRKMRRYRLRTRGLVERIVSGFVDRYKPRPTEPPVRPGEERQIPCTPSELILEQSAHSRDGELRQWIEVVRASSLFDAAWYREQYPDIATAGVDPATHYVRHGAAEKRNPAPGFDTRWYLEAYPDVAGREFNPLAHYLLYGYSEGREVRPVALGVDKFALLVSGCPGDAMRYRTAYQAEELRFLGLTVDTAFFDLVDYSAVLSQYRLFILHRVPHTHDIEIFIRRAKAAGKAVVFDTDDLVFNESLISNIKAIRDVPVDEYEVYVDGILRYHRTLSLCTAAATSTPHLRDSMLELLPDLPVYVNRNAMGDEMIKQAETALREILPPDDTLVRIAYFSGTRTHEEDFAQCVPALERLFELYPQVTLMIVGHLGIPKALTRFEHRMEITPLVPWQDLPGIFRRVDINLAPLEPNNCFTAAKSELKYFEAGLLGVPTVASDLGSYRLAITPGGNGFLCRDAEDWFDTLEALVLDPELRRRIGENARRDVLVRYTTRKRAPQLARVLREILDVNGPSRQRNLAIAFILRAPIAQTGGGYKTIFSLAYDLSERGHDVHLYVEPIAHLAAKNTEEIITFCREHFGQSSTTIHVGHNAICASDVAIATNWPTAYVVDRLPNTKCKAYFVQDYEPDFYDKVDPNYEAADRTYDLHLRKIVIGKYLDTLFSERDGFAPGQVSFALDRKIYTNLGIRPGAPPVRILFFARPGLKRRAYPVGVEALRRVAKACREVEIVFYGMAQSEEVGFEYENLGELTRSEVAVAMNRCHIHLSFSLTNISWVPFEAMACGCAVVEANVPSVQVWMEEGTCILPEPEPEAVAEALILLIRDHAFRTHVAASGEQYVHTILLNWPETCAQFESVLLKSVY